MNNSFLPAELIKKKKSGMAHSFEELKFIVEAYDNGIIPDYQMSAWAMAVCFQGMSTEEIASLTLLMKNSGTHFDFSSLNSFTVDKHSTGGIGDKTSLIIAPLVAAAGLKVPMIAGRGLGHTGGTLDKLESIPGFNINLTSNEFKDNINKHGFSIMGQTKEICPVDRKLYALRDVTSTVDSLALICASIMSKKLAEGLNALVLDVKYGSGAFMKDLDSAKSLAKILKATGENNQLPVTAIISNMNQPLGRYIGNSLEVKECIEIMKGQSCQHDDYDFYENTKELSLHLASHMVLLSNKVKDFDTAYDLCSELLKSGAAYKKFEEMCDFQGPSHLNKLPQAAHKCDILADQDSYLKAINCEELGNAAIELGAGRRAKTDKIDFSAGIEVHCYLGKKITKGDCLFTIYSNDKDSFEASSERIKKSLVFCSEPLNLNWKLIDTVF